MRTLFFIVALISNAALSTGQTAIQMEKKGGVYYVPCTVNGLKLQFIFDTGASDVSISLSEAMFMIKNGYMSEDDLIGTEYYRIANGELAEGTKLIIRTLEIGGKTLTDVKAAVVHSATAPLLLGQSVLEKFGHVSVNYESQMLSLGGNAAPTLSEVTPVITCQTAEECFGVGNNKMEQQQYVQAISVFNKAIEYNPDYKAAFGNRGYAKGLLNDYRGAIEDFTKVIELDPNEATGSHYRGLAKEKLKKYREAIEDYNKAIKLNDKVADVFGSRAAAKASLQDYRGAIDDLNTELELNPQKIQAYINKGYLKIILEDYRGAVVDLDKAIGMDSKGALAYYNRGIAKLRLKQLDSACLDLSKAAELGHDAAYDTIRESCN